MSLDEAAGRQSQIAGALRDGMEILNLSEEIEFQAYSRLVLPLDGYVFWIPKHKLKAKGSLHYAQEIQQNEDETFGLATVRFTSEEEIVEFSNTPINTIYVATFGKQRYAFSEQNAFFRAAKLWHYFGHSIHPVMLEQLLDTPGRLDPKQAVVSNSLPLWLDLNAYKAPYSDGFSNKLVLYPSYVVPPNAVPPYGVIHIEPSSTRALQPIPLLTADRSHYQLAADRVRVTLYGLQNNAACDFLDCVLQYSVDTEAFGIMNASAVMDGKRHQVELEALAMQKFIDFEVDYYQFRAQTVARKLIEKALVAFTIVEDIANP